MLFPKFSIGIDWTGWLTSSPEMIAYLDGNTTFNLKQVWGTEFKIPLKYYITNYLSCDVTPYYTYWRINDSDVVTISGTPLYEPESKTNELGVMTGLTYTF